MVFRSGTVLPIMMRIPVKHESLGASGGRAFADHMCSHLISRLTTESRVAIVPFVFGKNLLGYS